MYDEKLIKECIPSISYLAKKYENEEHDYDELFSEGLCSMIEYLSKTKLKNNNQLKQNIKRKVNNSINKLISNNTYNNRIDIDKCYIHKKFTNIIDLKSILNTREYEIIDLYYGFSTDNMSSVDIAKKYNISKSRVMQIKGKAERKIKNYIKQSEIFI